MARRRLLLVIDNLGWGGAQRQLANLAAGLSARGHQASIFVYNPGFDHVADTVREAGVPVIEVAKRSKFDVAPLRGLLGLVRRESFDAIIAYMPTPGAYASVVGRLAHVPTIVSERSFFRPGSLSVVDRLRRQPHRLATHVTANSHHARERMLVEFPWLRGRVTTIWNGIDTERYQPRCAGRVPPGEGPLRLLGVGTIVPGKEVERLAEALALLRERGGPPVEVGWAGKILDDPASKAIAEQVDETLARHQLSGSWKWLGLRRDVELLHGQYDALVHPSYLEGLPNAVCEALASGLPVIASRAADHARLVGADGDRGFLFEPADAASLSQAVERLARLADRERMDLGRRARAFAEQHLSLAVYVDQYEALIERLLARA